MSGISIVTIVLLALLRISVADDDEVELLTKLDCKPAETRVYNYESQTQLWGSLEENFLVSAEVMIHCMGYNETRINGTNALKYMVEIKKLKPSIMREKQNEINKNSKKRSKRSVGSWFRQAWKDVKDFFVTLFRARSVPTDTDFNFDIDSDVSSTSNQYQCKSGKARQKRSAQTNYEAIVYDKMFDIPFEFLQLIDGRIAEVRFSDKDTDVSVKNFKRHIADAFATQLNVNKQKVMEESPLGAHITRYSFDDSGKLDQSLQSTPDGSTLKLGGLLSLSHKSDLLKPNTISIMRDVSEDDVIQVGNGNSIVYDPTQIDINAKQIQQINEGRLTTTAGHLTLSLVNPSKVFRPKRSLNENTGNIEDHLKVRTKYSLSVVKTINKRSADNADHMKRLKDMESKLNFHRETIISQSSTKNSSREKLASIHKYLTELMSTYNYESDLIRYSSDHENPVYNTLLKALDIELNLNEDQSVISVSNCIRKIGNEKNLKNVCGDNISFNNKKCYDFLLILIKAQSKYTLEKLLMILKSKSDIEEKGEIFKLIVQTPNPPNFLIDELINMIKAQSDDRNYEGIILLAVTNLAYHSKSSAIKKEVSQLLIERLSKSKCEDNNVLLADTLEAVGNLGHESTIPFSIEIAERCDNSDAYKIAVIHSIRKLVSHVTIHQWLLKLIKDPKTNCIVNQEIINILIEDINNLEMSFEANERWPKYKFNEIDSVLSEKVIRMKDDTECLYESIIRYFERKNDENAKAVLKKIKKNRNKREIFGSFWNEANCREWKVNKDNKIEPNFDEPIVVSDKLREAEEFDTNVSYRRRKKCSAWKQFGPSQAQAVFRADVVNDLTGTEDNPEYKILAQFVMDTHFLGKDINIGKMYVYHRQDLSRAYVNIFGNTLVDARAADCNSSQPIQPYAYTNFFPLYDFNVWIVHMTMGIRVTGEMNFELPHSNCAPKKAEQIKTINLTPEARVTASGEASGKVLVIKGGINIGGDFNYFSNLEFNPNKDLCLSVYNGYKPMNVSIASWYQFWHPGCTEWMERSVWTPKSLNWQLNDYHKSAWIQDECLLKESKVSESNNYDP